MRKIATLLLTVALLVCAIPVMTTPALSATPGFQGLQGTVVNKTGAPMAAVTIVAVNSTTNSTLTTTTNSLGAFEWTVPSGTYNVTATYLNYNANTTYRRLVVPVGGSAVLAFTMYEILGTLHGFVNDGSTSVNGVTVFLANSLVNYTAITEAPLGEYRIINVQPGIYVATFEKKGYERTNSLPIEIVRGVVKQENASLQAQPCTLSGRVTENGNPLDGVTVTAKSQNKVATATTDINGNYTIQGLPSDSYVVTFSKKNYESKVSSLSLIPFEERKGFDISLSKAKNNNTATFLFGFDLPHSLMVIGLIMALITICVALFINFKVRKKPEMLGKDPQEDKGKE